MTRDGFSCFPGFQNFSGEGPRNPPPFLSRKYVLFFWFNTAQHKPLVKKWDFLPGDKQQE